MDFAEDSYVKIVGVSGDFHYGFIKTLTERGLHLLICLHEEGDSAVGYEIESGSMAADWGKLLSDTEKVIINSLSQGLATKDIADELALSPNTVRSHIRGLRLKLQLDNRRQLVAFAQGMDKRLKKKE
ncbi:hypothetical protein LCGC14_1168170 [marine sediment metagenome]|uniref:HTH luxR-type domain-containing protein n=1 Tax=marine sediment metagenome TaxID=412755 RepID=A0A0F9LVH6_9ZZZZ